MGTPFFGMKRATEARKVISSMANTTSFFFFFFFFAKQLTEAGWKQRKRRMGTPYSQAQKESEAEKLFFLITNTTRILFFVFFVFCSEKKQLKPDGSNGSDEWEPSSAERE